MSLGKTHCSYCSLKSNVGTQRISKSCSLPSFPLDNNWPWCVNGDSCSPTLRLLIQTIYSNEFRALNKPEVSRVFRRNCSLLSNADDVTPALPACEDNIRSWSPRKKNKTLLITECVSFFFFPVISNVSQNVYHKSSKVVEDWIILPHD